MAKPFIWLGLLYCGLKKKGKRLFLIWASLWRNLVSTPYAYVCKILARLGLNDKKGLLKNIAALENRTRLLGCFVFLSRQSPRFLLRRVMIGFSRWKRP